MSINTMESVENIYSHLQPKNERLLNLAVDRLLIYPSDKKKILERLKEESEDTPDRDVIDIFKQEKYIKDDKIATLLARDEHLKTRFLDQDFGKLAVSNSMISSESVEQSLNHQRKLFKQGGETKTIGDILTEEGLLTATERIAILLTQNRIQDDQLMDAFHEMGENRNQKEFMNKRFAAIAIKQARVTIEQVNAALDVQKKEVDTGKPVRFVAQILLESADLSASDLNSLLLILKQSEKRRFDLEKALYSAKAEMKISKKLNRLFSYTISKDGLCASVKKIKQTEESFPVYEFLIWLRRVGIKYGLVNDDVLEDFIRVGEVNSIIDVANGYPPKPCVDERFELFTGPDDPDCTQSTASTTGQDNTRDIQEETSSLPEIESPVDKEPEQPVEPETDDDQTPLTIPENEDPCMDDPENDADLNAGASEIETGEDQSLIFFKKGSQVAQIIPGETGKPGKSVLGYSIQPETPTPCIVNAGKGVKKKGLFFVSLIDGYPVLKNGSTLTITASVEKETVEKIMTDLVETPESDLEPKDFEVDGSILQGVSLTCRSLILTGDLKGSVTCYGDAVIKGDIRTSEDIDESGNENGATLLCNGTIKASKQILNSSIQTFQHLYAPNSTVAGSEVIACNGMSVKNVSKNKDRNSVLWFGLEPDDKAIALFKTIESINKTLDVLKKKEEIEQLKMEYDQELGEEKKRQMELAILTGLLRIIKGPELYQHESLSDKLQYLRSLPEFSSIRAYYMDIPRSESAAGFIKQVLDATADLSMDDVVKQIQDQAAMLEDGEEDPDDTIERIETGFKGRLGALEQEISTQSQAINDAENELEKLHGLNRKLKALHLKTPAKSESSARIRNMCEKGTVIRGKVAHIVVEKTYFNVTFKEILDQKTQTAYIEIDS